MAWLGGVPQINAYEPGFFTLLDEQFLVVNDYPYSGMSFWDDFDLPLPEEEEWSDAGMNETMLFICFVFLVFYDFFLFVFKLVTKHFNFCMT